MPETRPLWIRPHSTSPYKYLSDKSIQISPETQFRMGCDALFEGVTTPNSRVHRPPLQNRNRTFLISHHVAAAMEDTSELATATVASSKPKIARSCPSPYRQAGCARKSPSKAISISSCGVSTARAGVCMISARHPALSLFSCYAHHATRPGTAQYSTACSCTMYTLHARPRPLAHLWYV